MKWFKIGDVAKSLDIATHNVRHYTDKLTDVLGNNVRIDPTNNFTMYNSEAIRILANVKKMVQIDHMNLSEVRKVLINVKNDGLPAKFELDAAKSFDYIRNIIEEQQKQIEQLVKALSLLTGRLEGFEQLPSVIKSYHDDLDQVFQQINRVEQDVSVVQELKERLEGYEKENAQMKQMIEELKTVNSRNEEMVKQELEKSVNLILEDNQNHWASLKIQEKIEEESERKKRWWSRFFGG